MKREAGPVLAAAAETAAAPHAGWRISLPALAACIALLLAIYWPTAASIVAIWARSETFAHGYLIVPIALWLVWMKRRELARLAPSPDPLGLLVLAGATAAWLAANAGGVLVIEQYAMAAMVPAVVLALAGRQVARAAAFPLAFLLFAVPVGEALIPPLMQWTADFTVTALRLTGIPVYREGLYFVIPSGSWSVVEGCSGLRYLIASVTVGSVYAYLTYRRFSRRALFMVLAVVVPILANGLRAYMIVMIAHLSDMKLALGVDHFIYGWVFFGLVMLLLFWLGSLFRDAQPPRAGDAAAAPARRPATRRALAASAAAALGVAASGPLYAAWLERSASSAAAPALSAAAAGFGWSQASVAVTSWRPHYGGAEASVFAAYRKGERTVALYLGYYRNQRQGGELVNSQNVMVVQKHPAWANVGETARVEALAGAPVKLRETRLRAAEQRLLVWDWFWVSGQHLGSPYLAKLYLARDKLLVRGDDAAAIVIAAPYAEDAGAAQQTLREFVREMLPSLEAALSAAKASR